MRSMQRFWLDKVLILLSLLCSALVSAQPINMINDVSHKYTFFFAWKNQNSFGGKFGYVDWKSGQSFRQSQASLSSLDLSNVNLLNLVTGSKYDLPYTEDDKIHLDHYLTSGGGLFIVNTENSDNGENVAALLKHYGASISSSEAEGDIITGEGERYETEEDIYMLELDPAFEWLILAADESNNPIIASRKFAKGYVTISSFSPFQRIQTRGKDYPDDFRFPNYELVQSIFKHTASGKQVVTATNLANIEPELSKDFGAFQIRFNRYSTYVVERVLKDYNTIYPILEKYMGVPMVAGSAPGEKFTIDLLATKGAGVSFGKRIGISMFNDNFFGILGHELTHSWVTPHGEPLSGEGIAIHVGTKVTHLAAKKVGDKKTETFAANNLNTRIEAGLKQKEKFQQWDPVNMSVKDGIQYGKKITHGKYLYVLRHFEQKYGADAVAKYFQMKRKYVPVKNFDFTGHDSVWLWSKATGEDQFGYFQQIGIKADKSKVSIPAAKS